MSSTPYYWNPSCLGGIFALPCAVVDQHIRLAGSAQLKVLLWLSCHGQGTFDPAACSAAIGLSPADCTDALQYWEETGLLRLGEPAASSAAPASPAVPTAPVSAPAPAPAAAEKAPALPAAVPRPRAVKPTFQEVLARQKGSEEFAYLLETVSARLGRPITHGDMETLLYLFDTAGLPAAVILMIVAYAVAAGKPHMRYIEKVALNWADQGIDTVPAAEQHLCYLERRDRAGTKVQALLGLERSLTISQMETAEKWIHQWKLSDALIQEAARSCHEKIGKYNCSYIDKILAQWHEEGIRTPEQIPAKPAAKSRSRGMGAPAESSLDLEDYEKRLQDFVPVYKDEA